MRRLVESWIEAERHRCQSIASAIKILNKDLGMNVTHSRVAEWRRGVYVPSQLVLSYMLRRTLARALQRVGITVSGAQLAELQKLLWVVREKDGRPEVELM